jgi:hypothetical protein
MVDHLCLEWLTSFVCAFCVCVCVCVSVLPCVADWLYRGLDLLCVMDQLSLKSILF